MTRYYAGPWVWDDSEETPSPHYRAPAGTVAVVDLRSLPLQSVGQHASGTGHGFFSGQDGLSLPSEYTLLGTGDLRDLQIGGAVRSAWESLYGVRVPGDAGKLIDCLSYTLTDGADPEGLSGPKPLVPGVGPPVGECCIHLAGHSVVYSSTVDVIRGQSRHARSVRHMMQRELENLAETDPDPELWRRVLASQKEKYGLRWDSPDEDAWLTPKLRAKGKGRNGRTYAEPHSTTYTESFPTDGFMPTGQDLSWTRYHGSAHLQVISGVLREPTVLMAPNYFMGTSLSSSDHAAWITITNDPTASIYSWVNVAVRKESGASTMYVGRYAGTASGGYTNQIRKIVAGTESVLAISYYTYAAPFVHKIGVSGSRVELLRDGVWILSVADTAISGHVLTVVGMCGDAPNSVFTYADDWGCEDSYTAWTRRVDLGLLLGVS